MGESTGPEGMTVREMEIADLEQVMVLEREVFSTPWSADVFRHEIRRRGRTLYTVAVTVDRVVGYMGAGIMGHEIHVANLAVDQRARRRGIGSALFLDCLRQGIDRGARWLVLEVRETNEPAREFYRLFGLRELGLRIGYYSDTGEHALVLATGDICAPEYTELLVSIEAGLAEKEAGGRC